MANTMQFQYAVFLMPGYAGDPSASLREVLSKKYPQLKLVDQIPKEPVLGARQKAEGGGGSKQRGEADIEKMDFLRTRELRQAIHAREGGKCFYCRRQTPSRSHCLDHVVPRAESGLNSYRYVVSCRMECNWQKKDRPAADFLRELYREGRLSREDLGGGLARARRRQATAKT